MCGSFLVAARFKAWVSGRSLAGIAVSNPAARSWWLHGLRRGSAAARLLGLGGSNPAGAWMSVSCECCVLSGRGLLIRADHS